MRKQRNIFQIKEWHKIPGNEVNKMETTNLSDKKFKAVVIRLFNELRG